MSDSLPPVQLGYSKDPSPEEFAKRQVGFELDIRAAPTDPVKTRHSEMLRLAEVAFSKTGLWVVFYRSLLGLEGAMFQLFPDPTERHDFQMSAAHAEIQEMVAAMRSTDTSKGDGVEPERMITIRVPMSLHSVLVDESEQLGLSINQICVSKLLGPLNSRHIPEPQGRRRGRKPGPQGSKKVAQ